MMTADEARKRSEVIRERLVAERRNSSMKTIEILIIDAVAKGEAQITVDLDANDIEYVIEKVTGAGYETAKIHNGIAIRWMR